ncbi:hypothetical protein COEREDRAFT_81395 [Coemansia reversa NRRL 1564]|uniref:Uncharacterized protein n=1 Tax=Coemansia reversa (strain ATCC 12441 / NRRL 1564) TaxID=763665 RepID=A0A2G5BAY8_COERN|nr:hypothetical protein COEREDRAFT_81395 [Coemansia reversa NRRL 1564]|eukprot:PIA16173.1 hypothetical protein COEREDRAFT_81395 [Coemansia reversa NRRL 1564]
MFLRNKPIVVITKGGIVQETFVWGNSSNYLEVLGENIVRVLRSLRGNINNYPSSSTVREVNHGVNIMSMHEGEFFEELVKSNWKLSTLADFASGL